MCTDLQKKTAPQYNSNFLNCKKNQEKANNSPSYRCAAIKKIDPKAFWDLFRLRSQLSATSNFNALLCDDTSVTGGGGGAWRSRGAN